LEVDMPLLPFLFFTLLQAAPPPPSADASNQGLPDPRRVLTAEGKDGHASIIADGVSENARVLNGSKITRLWETTQMPAPLGVTKDDGATAGNAYREGFLGTSLYVADLPAGIKIDMHKQDSLDHIAVLTGEVDLVLEKGPVRLHHGDVLVQAGNLHGWANPTSKPSRIMVVVITGKRPATASDFVK
jgi:quercetin dioxygenase-like cupin family protein